MFTTEKSHRIETENSPNRNRAVSTSRWWRLECSNFTLRHCHTKCDTLLHQVWHTATLSVTYCYTLLVWQTLICYSLCDKEYCAADICLTVSLRVTNLTIVVSALLTKIDQTSHSLKPGMLHTQWFQTWCTWLIVCVTGRPSYLIAHWSLHHPTLAYFAPCVYTCVANGINP